MSGVTSGDGGSSTQLDHTAIGTLDLLDHTDVDWSRVQRTAYLVHQHLRYEYPGPIHDLTQRLIIVPPERHGDQRLVVHRLEVSSANFQMSSRTDEFGNTVITVQVPVVDASIDFEAWIVAERRAGGDMHRVPASVLDDKRLREPSTLTRPDAALREVAARLAAGGESGFDLAHSVTLWVYRTMGYAHAVTDIGTTAAEALAMGRGVCQDYAHVMLALCRLCGLPARYVSGHLLGEGGTHAWVEVLGAAPDNPDEALVWALDPTHGRRATFSYLTVAVGRDYNDVAPTSGTFSASYRGQLSTRKRVDLTEVEYSSAEMRDQL